MNELEQHQNLTFTYASPQPTGSLAADRRILLDPEKSCPYIEVADKKCICKAIYLNAYGSRYPELTYYDLLKCTTIWKDCPNFKIEKNLFGEP